jgi:hypothetical protein
MIDIKYGIFFTLDLLHQYFGDNACPDFTLIPSTATSDLLQGNKMIAKQYSNRLVTGVELDSSGNLIVVPKDGLNLTFFLKLNNPLFLNYTNLLIPPTNGMVYYFSNRNNNTSGGTDLTKDINPYSGTVTYQPGNLVVSSGNVYQAWRTCTGADPQTDTQYWVKVGNIPYVSENDAVSLTPTWMQDENYGTNVLGVIDLFCDSALPANYQMLGASNQLLSPAYRIQFPNRYLLWKYILKQNSAGTIADTSPGGYKFQSGSPNPPNTIVSVTPIPFSETPITTFKLTIGSNDYTPIANASPERLAFITMNAEILTCSEIYLNY